MDIFRNSAKSIPKSDDQIVRVSMEEDQIQGRKSHLPAQETSPVLTISHMPNAGTSIGTK
jgi:hypothetical protein